MKNPKIIYILISAFCIFAIAAGVYEQFFVTNNGKTGGKGPNISSAGGNTKAEISQEDLKKQLSSIYTNAFDSKNYDVSNIEKLNAKENIVYTAINIDEQKENYEIKVSLPAINIKGDVAANFNNITQTIFVNKASEIMNNQNTNQTRYTARYMATINGSILSVVIESTLKEGDNPQRIIIQTYNYNLQTGEKVEVPYLLSQKNIVQSDCQNKINEVVQKASEDAQILVQSGYTAYNRDLSSTIYLLSNLSTYFLGQNGDLYIIFAYGNQNYTSDMDIIWYE